MQAWKQQKDPEKYVWKRYLVFAGRQSNFASNRKNDQFEDH